MNQMKICANRPDRVIVEFCDVGKTEARHQSSGCCSYHKHVRCWALRNLGSLDVSEEQRLHVKC